MKNAIPIDSIRKMPRWLRNGLIALLGAILYAILNMFSNRLLLPSATFIALRPQVALPFFLGFIFGPGVGFMCGFLGNLIGDALCGYGLLQFWNWHIANGLYGLIPGIARMLGLREIRSLRGFVTLETIIVLTNTMSVLFAVCTDILWVGAMQFPESLNAWILPAFITNTVHAFVLVPLFLVAAKFIVITVETRTTLVLSWLLVFIVALTAFGITWSIWNDLTSQAASVKAFYSAGVITVLVVILGFVISTFLTYRITEPIRELSRAAGQIEQGKYALPELDKLADRPDEFGRLSKLMQRMAAEVEKRETHLKKEVAELKIEIDRSKQAEDVREIVDSDYFKSIQTKARAFRNRPPQKGDK